MFSEQTGVFLSETDSKRFLDSDESVCCSLLQRQLKILVPRKKVSGRSWWNTRRILRFCSHENTANTRDAHPTTRWVDYKSTHTMVQSHSGFFFFYHYTSQGVCLRTLIPPLEKTTGLLNSWVFPFLPRTSPTSTDRQGGVSFQSTPMRKNHSYSHSPDSG